MSNNCCRLRCLPYLSEADLGKIIIKKLKIPPPLTMLCKLVTGSAVILATADATRLAAQSYPVHSDTPIPRLPSAPCNANTQDVMAQKDHW